MNILGKLFGAASAILLCMVLALALLLDRAGEKTAKQQEDLGKLKAVIQQYETQEKLRAEQVQKTETALSKREEGNQDAAAQKEQRQNTWEQMKRDDETIRTWADQPLPASVFRLRQGR